MARTNTQTTSPAPTSRDWAHSYATAKTPEIATALAAAIAQKAAASERKTWARLSEYIRDGKIAHVKAFAIKDADKRKAAFAALAPKAAPKAKAMTQAELLAGLSSGAITQVPTKAPAAPAPAPAEAAAPAQEDFATGLASVIAAFMQSRNA